MSDLRAAALSALEGRAEARAAEEAKAKIKEAEDAIARVRRSPLGKWFPDVEWEFVGNCTNGVTLVREKDGLPTVIGVTSLLRDSKDAWEVAIYRASPFSGIFTVKQWDKSQVLKEPADLGAYIARTEPRPAP